MNYLEAKKLYGELKSEKYLWLPENPVYMAVQSRYELAILTLHKEKFGKKAKDWQKAFNHLKNYFESDLTELVKPFQDEVKSRYEAIKAKKELNEKDLELFARGFTPEKQSEKFLLKTSEAWAYHTQGWGANKYARQALNEDIKLFKII